MHFTKLVKGFSAGKILASVVNPDPYLEIMNSDPKLDLIIMTLQILYINLTFSL
jgi:hypothetical protein